MTAGPALSSILGAFLEQAQHLLQELRTLEGLEARTSRAPIRRAFSAAAAWPVRTMMGMRSVSGSLRRRSITSKPSMPGMSASKMIRWACGS